MDTNSINYNQLVDEAMHLVIYKVLKLVEQTGLPNEHYFFISFLTQYPNVKISNGLLSTYSKEMSIVLQYQFHNLKVTPQHFEVSLNFGGTMEHISIPFAAIVTFADPSVEFALRFHYNQADNIIIPPSSFLKHNIKNKPTKQKKTTTPIDLSNKSNNIISIAEFKKNK